MGIQCGAIELSGAYMYVFVSVSTVIMHQKQNLLLNGSRSDVTDLPKSQKVGANTTIIHSQIFHVCIPR